MQMSPVQRNQSLVTFSSPCISAQRHELPSLLHQSVTNTRDGITGPNTATQTLAPMYTTKHVYQEHYHSYHSSQSDFLRFWNSTYELITIKLTNEKGGSSNKHTTYTLELRRIRAYGFMSNGTRDPEKPPQQSGVLLGMRNGDVGGATVVRGRWVNPETPKDYTPTVGQPGPREQGEQREGKRAVSPEAYVLGCHRV
uniref:Uncharacterized protein n=1 Tax=Knipowitschia caucasica TaxID=637954 RepID=A0AAV2MD54_KNICA